MMASSKVTLLVHNDVLRYVLETGSLKSELNALYLDDGFISGQDVERFLSDLRTDRRVGSTIGLTLTEDKCELRYTGDVNVVSTLQAVMPSTHQIQYSEAVLLNFHQDETQLSIMFQARRFVPS
jgi:hypothetical protein